MKMLGLGFMFSAKDKGLSKGLRDTANGLSAIDRTHERLSAGLKGSFLPRFLQSLQTNELYKMGDTLDDLAGKMGPKGSITTSLESFYMTANKSAKKMAFNMGGNTKELTRQLNSVTGAAYALNEDVGTSQTALMTLKRYFDDAQIAALGLADATKLVKTAATVADFPGWAKEVSMVSKALKIDVSAADDFIDNVYRIGGAAGYGEDAVKQTAELVDKLTKKYQVLGSQPEMMKQAVVGINELAMAYTQTGMNLEESFANAEGIFDSLMSQTKGLADAMTGLGGGEDMFKTIQGLGFALKDVGAAQDMLSKSPVEFMLKLIERYDTATGDVQGRIRKLFEEQNLTKLLDDKSAKDFLKKMASMNGSLDKLGPGFLDAAQNAQTAALTIDEQLDRMEVAFKTRLNRIASKDINLFVKRSAAGYKTLGDGISYLAADEGPLGLLIRKLVAVNRVGLSALFPVMGKFGDLAMTSFANMAPMLTAMGSLGFRLGSLAKPFGMVNKLMLGLPGTLMSIVTPVAMVGGGIVLLGKAFKNGDKIAGAFQKQIDGLPESLYRLLSFFGGERLSKAMLKDFRKMGSKQQWAAVREFGGKIASETWAGLRSDFMAGVTGVKDIVQTLARALWDQRTIVTDGFTKAWSWALGTAWPNIMATWTTDVRPVVANGLRDLWKWTTDSALPAVEETLSGWMKTAWGWAVYSAWPWVKEKTLGLFDKVTTFIGDIDFKGMGKSVWKWLSDSFNYAVIYWRRKDIGEKIASAVSAGMQWLGDNYQSIAATVVPWAEKVAGNLWKTILGAVDTVGDKADKAAVFGLGVAEKLGSWLEGAAKWIVSVDFSKAIGAVATFFSGIFDSAWQRMSETDLDPSVAATPIERVFENIGKSAGTIVSKVGGAIRDIYFAALNNVTARVKEWWMDPTKSMFQKWADLLPNVLKALALGAIFSSAIRGMIFGGLKSAIGFLRHREITSLLGKVSSGLCAGMTPTNCPVGPAGAAGAAAAGAAGAGRGAAGAAAGAGAAAAGAAGVGAAGAAALSPRAQRAARAARNAARLQRTVGYTLPPAPTMMGRVRGAGRAVGRAGGYVAGGARRVGGALNSVGTGLMGMGQTVAGKYGAAKGWLGRNIGSPLRNAGGRALGTLGNVGMAGMVGTMAGEGIAAMGTEGSATHATGKAISYGATGATLGATIGSAIAPGVGTAIGAALGGVGGAAWGVISSLTGAADAEEEWAKKEAEQRRAELAAKREFERAKKAEAEAEIKAMTTYNMELDTANKEYAERVFGGSESLKKLEESADKAAKAFSDASTKVDIALEGMTATSSYSLAKMDQRLGTMNTVLDDLESYATGSKKLSRFEMDNLLPTLKGMAAAGLITTQQLDQINASGSLYAVRNNLGAFGESLGKENARLTDKKRMKALELEKLWSQVRIIELGRELKLRGIQVDEEKAKQGLDMPALKAQAGNKSIVDMATERFNRQMKTLDEGKNNLNSGKASVYVGVDGKTRTADGNAQSDSGKVLRLDLEQRAKQYFAEYQQTLGSIPVPPEVKAEMLRLNNMIADLSMMDTYAFTDSWSEVNSTVANVAQTVGSAAMNAEAILAQVDATMKGIQERRLAVENETLTDILPLQTQIATVSQDIDKAASDVAGGTEYYKDVILKNGGSVDLYNKALGAGVIPMKALDLATSEAAKQAGNSSKATAQLTRVMASSADFLAMKAAFTGDVETEKQLQKEFARYTKSGSELDFPGWLLENSKRNGGLYEKFVGKTEGKARGGVVNFPQSGQYELLHGRELVWPMDRAPSQEAIAGMNQVMAKSRVDKDASVIPIRDAAKMAEVLAARRAEASSNNDDVVAALRTELAKVRAVLEQSKRFVLVDTRGTSVGSVEQRTKNSGLR